MYQDGYGVAAAPAPEEVTQKQAADQAGCDSPANKAYSPLRARLQSDAANLGSQHSRTIRAHDILARHPEFEELIELLGLITVPIRLTPLRAERALVLE